jgi:hypothetical protein
MMLTMLPGSPPPPGAGPHLHRQEGSAGVGIEVPLPKLEAGIKESAAIGHPGGIHQTVDLNDCKALRETNRT